MKWSRVLLLLGCWMAFGAFSGISHAEESQVGTPQVPAADAARAVGEGSETEAGRASGETGSGPNLQVRWFTMDDSSASSSGSGLRISGSVGQPSVVTSSGGGLTVTGGFWVVPRAAGGECSDPAAIFCDGFESGSVSRWSNAVGGEFEF